MCKAKISQKFIMPSERSKGINGRLARHRKGKGIDLDDLWNNDYLTGITIQQ
jgi:hypothetical protein